MKSSGQSNIDIAECAKCAYYVHGRIVGLLGLVFNLEPGSLRLIISPAQASQEGFINKQITAASSAFLAYVKAS